VDLVARNSGGYQLVGRPQARRPWYPSNRVRPVRVEIWRRYDDEVAAAAVYLGTFAPGQTVKLNYDTNVARTMIFSIVTISPNNVRSVRELADALEVAHLFDPAAMRAAPGPLAPTPAPFPTRPTGIRFKRG
jgi:hypothetical protein